MGNKFEGFLIQGGSKKLDRIFDKKELGLLYLSKFTKIP
jgi:hypothetical protein